jgi:hypothetical protein
MLNILRLGYVKNSIRSPAYQIGVLVLFSILVYILYYNTILRIYIFYFLITVFICVLLIITPYFISILFRSLLNLNLLNYIYLYYLYLVHNLYHFSEFKNSINRYYYHFIIYFVFLPYNFPI